MPPAAIGTTPPTPHNRLTSTRAPRLHGTPQEQPAVRSEVHVLARARVEGRHDGLAAARGEVRQQPRRRRREDADPGPHSKHRPPERSSPSMSPAPPPFFFGRPGLFESVRTSRARRSFAAAAALVAPRVRGGFRSSSRLCRGGRGGGGHRGIGRRRLSGDRLANRHQIPVGACAEGRHAEQVVHMPSRRLRERLGT